MPPQRVAHQLVADRYELLDTVGRGGFGVVWRACDTLLQRHVAVKEIHLPGFLAEGDQVDLREKVLREARAAARLDHPGAVTVYDVIDDEGIPVIVMELVDAPNLSELVAQRGPLGPAEVARIGLEVLEVLAVAHAHGIVHRDVKPANVMVGDSGRVRLGDFGVAAILDDPTVTTSGSVTGSPAYMAPEQATNNGAVPESDLWSLGATMYFAVEGQPPFDKGSALATLTSIVGDPPRPAERAGELRPVLEALLVKRPEDRLGTDRLRRRLSDLVSAEAPATVPAPTVAAATRPGDTAVIPLSAPVDAAPGAPAAPTAPPRRARTGPPPASRPGARLSPAVLGLVALVVVALVAVGLTRRRSTASPKAASSSATTAIPTTATPAKGGAGSRAGPTAGSTATAPAPVGGTVAYSDPVTGFSISRPSAWAPRADGTLTDFRDPDSGAYLRVDHIEPPGPSPQGAWFELEKSFAAENANYHRIRIEPTSYNGFDAAIWEFTYSAGGADLHVVDLGMVTGRYGFALYFQTRAADWNRLQPVFESFKASFKAPK